MPAKKGMPRIDITRVSSGYNQNRLHTHDVVYFSNFKGFSPLLKRSDKVRRALWKEAAKARTAWKRQIPFGSDGSDGHIRDHVKIRPRLNGGDKKDRFVYEVYNDYPRYDEIDRGRRNQDGRADTWFWAAVKSMERGGLL